MQTLRVFARPTRLALAALAASAAPVLAQGGDECSGATPIAGFGTFVVNTLAATTSPPPPSAGCGAFEDVWFTWTAPSTAFVRASTCGGVSADTIIDVYTGSCGSLAILACNDDDGVDCSVESTVFFAATAGTTYVLRLGGWLPNTHYSGSFSIDASPSCGGLSVPDLVVGDVSDVLNVTSAAGFDAVALGATTCNRGAQLASWNASSSAHPILRQSVYRYRVEAGAGRFEQIGASWPHHPGSVANTSYCCLCSGSGPDLMPLCASSTPAAASGVQASAGPSSEVDAFTGTFPFPPSNPPVPSALARRCVIATSDLQPTGLPGAPSYLGEVQVLSADDAAAGSAWNNVSWRRMTCSSGEPTLAFQFATVREQPALRAWSLYDAGALVGDVPIPGEGLLVVGAKATNLGGGTWHYEYAVFNMNSDRAVGSFTLPLPASVTATNIGFHDVAYHDGDGLGGVDISGADWPATSAPGALTWACVPFATDPNANALRFGTTYNFRFDANAPPVNGSATLGLWKPGTPASVTAAVPVPSGTNVVPFCLGDGSQGTCPCGNNGASGHGCGNAAFAAGAQLTASGTSSVANDTLAFQASNLTGSIAIFFQGGSQVPPAFVDDGLGCTGGPIVRFPSSFASGTSSYPGPGQPGIALRGGVPASGGEFFYQCFYRNATVAFCPPATSNRTNGLRVVWTP